MIFELAVQSVLHSLIGIDAFIDEEQLHSKKKELCPRYPFNIPTPDFMLKNVTKLNGIDFAIRWVEVKMFYGAATLMHSGDNSIVGSILSKAERYVSLYGCGAFLFSFGCGIPLVESLLELGVVVLEPSIIPMEQMHLYQRSWCADSNGEILP